MGRIILLRPSEVRKYLKRAAIAGSFFVLAFLLYVLGMSGALTFYALVSAVVLVLMILIQSGRGSGLAALGGMDSESVLGTHSATPIAKATYIVGALFIFICMLTARLSLIDQSGPGQSQIDTGALPTQQEDMPTTSGQAPPGGSMPADGAGATDGGAATSEGGNGGTQPADTGSAAPSPDDQTGSGEKGSGE